MPVKTYRITKCQRAAFCGLMIAGLRFDDACAVADVSRQRIHDVLPPRWVKPPRFKHYKSWKGQTLEQLRLAYADRSQYTKDIAARFGIDVTYLYRLATKNGWPARSYQRKQQGRLQDHLTPDQFRLYNKLRAHGIARTEAFAEALR